ncbi:hypothetical protein ACF07V_17160 [Streptomyces sp. NPDC015661]|uniref:hypothetical protein n=1 Tax=Streptomyces sp. NPDC015661 TaxID=3364961 RepID=UPI0036F70AA9
MLVNFAGTSELAPGKWFCPAVRTYAHGRINYGTIRSLWPSGTARPPTARPPTARPPTQS